MGILCLRFSKKSLESGFPLKKLWTFTSLFKTTLSAFTVQKGESRQNIAKRFAFDWNTKTGTQFSVVTPPPFSSVWENARMHRKWIKLSWTGALTFWWDAVIVSSLARSKNCSSECLNKVLHLRRMQAFNIYSTKNKLHHISSVKIILWRQQDDFCKAGEVLTVPGVEHGISHLITPDNLQYHISKLIVSQTSCRAYPRLHGNICHIQSLVTSIFVQNFAHITICLVIPWPRN